MIKGYKSGEFAVTLASDHHKVTSDVSKELGGTDQGLDPHEMAEAALGACTLLTLQLYAKRKGWDVSRVTVEVKITKEGSESEIERKLDFGNLPADQVERLREIANKCPIHKLLESNIKIINL